MTERTSSNGLPKGTVFGPYLIVRIIGIARQDGPGAVDGLTKTNTLLGTPQYMSPEQARGAKSTDVRSDQFSLGVILYRGATGVLPFQGEGLYGVLHAIISAVFVPPRVVRPEIPVGLEAVIVRAMQRNPAERFRDVRALGAALLAFASPAVRAQWEGEFGGSERDETTIGRPAAVLPAHAMAPSSTASDL